MCGLFSITWYPNGFDFLEGWHRDADIVFMDSDMPDMNGMETAHRMREADTNVVLIFVTNLAQYAIGGYWHHGAQRWHLHGDLLRE